jgi:hypothetical protein
MFMPIKSMENTIMMDTVTLKNENLRLHVARMFGPRIVSVCFKGGANLLAELPEVVTERPDGKLYHFYGGHRLWLAPEDPIRSYGLDDMEMEISQKGNNLLVRKPVEPETGIGKSMQITLADAEAKVTITHCLENLGAEPVSCAPWAITQLRTGGVAILPQVIAQTELLPNRALALWPYADISSSQVSWGNRFILVRSEKQPPFKVGFMNPRGWLGYWLDGTLFYKRSTFKEGGDYVDFGSSSECYCNQQFIELETLGPLVTLAPGESVTHTELWGFQADVEYPKSEDTVQSIVDEIGLE